jgi:putative acetyltransferase
MGLLPHARHRGIGTRLLQAAIDAAWAEGLARIELSVRAGNANARALYRRHGFEDEGIRRRAYRTDGRFEDGHAMALLRALPP